MRAPISRRTVLVSFFIVSGLLFFLMEYMVRGERHGSLLLNLSFWCAIVQGSVGIVAAADICKGGWITPLKKVLLAPYPLLLFFSILFFFTGFQSDLYPWEKYQGAWLNTHFFILRNAAVLLASFILARAFALASLREDRKKNTYAALYLFILALAQSLIAFDWVMSLEYPWISTLFGGYFLIESIYSGIALAGIYGALFYRKALSEKKSSAQGTLRDSAMLAFGFSILWGGFLFAQFLTIWYGNLPEEVSYIVARVRSHPFLEMLCLVVIMLFIVPFLIYLSRSIKGRPSVVMSISLSIILGLLIERFSFLAFNLPINVFLFSAEFLLLALLYFSLVIRQEFFPQ